jgi:quercetin dioxygenase-like cupin family protein
LEAPEYTERETMNTNLDQSKDVSVAPGSAGSGTGDGLRHGRSFGRGRKLAALGAAGLAVVITGTVLATPGSGAAGQELARASFADRVDIKMKLRDEKEVVHVPNAGQTVIQRIVFSPGGQTGWHSHPGPAIALVVRGELTLYSGDDPTCAGRVYSAGQAFVDSGQGHVHLGRNLATTETEVWVTYLDVPTGGAFRLDAPNPGVCPF